MSHPLHIEVAQARIADLYRAGANARLASRRSSQRIWHLPVLGLSISSSADGRSLRIRVRQA